MVYQDAVTGEVLPYFGDTSNIEDYHVRSGPEDCERFGRLKVDYPSSRAIKKAYDQYMKLKKFNTVSEDTEVELGDEFIDEDEQTFLDTGVEDNLFVEERKEKKSLRKMDVILVQDTKVELNVLIPVYIKITGYPLEVLLEKLQIIGSISVWIKEETFRRIWTKSLRF